MLLIALNLSIIFNLSWNSSFVILSSTNHHATLGMFYVVASAGGLIMAHLSIPVAGLMSAALCLAAVKAVLAIYLLPRLCRTVNDTISNALWDSIKYETFRKYIVIYWRRVTSRATNITIS